MIDSYNPDSRRDALGLMAALGDEEAVAHLLEPWEQDFGSLVAGLLTMIESLMVDVATETDFDLSEWLGSMALAQAVTP